MLSKKQHLRYCLLFNLKKNTAETKEMISSVLDKNAVSYTCKKWFQQFREANYDLEDRKRLNKSKKWRQGVGGNFGREFLSSEINFKCAWSNTASFRLKQLGRSFTGSGRRNMPIFCSCDIGNILFWSRFVARRNFVYQRLSEKQRSVDSIQYGRQKASKR